MTRALCLAVFMGVVGLSTAGCQESAEDRRSAYCDQVETDSDELTQITDEAGAGAFLDALPILEGLAEKSPGDLKDEWQTFLNALHGLRDAVEEAGLEPAQIDGSLPQDMDPADRRRVREAATVLQEPQVTAAAQGIEQHALDICDTPLL